MSKGLQHLNVGVLPASPGMAPVALRGTGPQSTRLRGWEGQAESNTVLSWARETHLLVDLYTPHDLDFWMWGISYNNSILWSKDALCFPQVGWPEGSGCCSNW